MSFDSELDAFKRLDLRAYAGSHGYTLSEKEGWAGSDVMRSATDKIVVKLDRDGHYLYCSCYDPADSGTIIDFVKRRKGLSLGRVRQELRPWLKGGSVSPRAYEPLQPTPKDRSAVERAIQSMRVAENHRYLEGRGITAAILGSDRFYGRIRSDGRSNAVFPHFDRDGMCGFEVKNEGFTSFASGGEKGLWLSRFLPGDMNLVIAESAIDALSYAVLFPDDNCRYASTGGTIGSRHRDLIAEEIGQLPHGGHVTAAMDNDEGGKRLAQQISQAFGTTKRLDIASRIHLPQRQGEDWNDVVQRRRQFSLPIALPSPHS